jgi:hypothetical protein
MSEDPKESATTGAGQNVTLTKEIIARIKAKLDTLEGKEVAAGKLRFDLNPDVGAAATWSVTYTT